MLLNINHSTYCFDLELLNYKHAALLGTMNWVFRCLLAQYKVVSKALHTQQ